MYKVIILSGLLMVLSGQQKQEHLNIDPEPPFDETSVVEYDGTVAIQPVTYIDRGDYRGKKDYKIPWENDPLDISDSLVIDERVALDIANAVFRNLYGEDYIQNTRFFVYQPEENVLVVTRCSKSIQVDGGSISIAISMEDGRIMKIWGGE